MTFTIFPAIDLRRGQVVRLQYGDPDRQTTFSGDPLTVGQKWVDAGAAWIHAVNLDGAFGEASAANWAILPGLARLPVRLQFGGGIRTMAEVEAAFQAGVDRLVLGTAAVENPAFCRAVIAAFGVDRVAVGIDSRDGEVKTRGWQSGSGRTPLALARQMAELGVKTIIHTDISRDGVLTGVNAAESAALAAATGLEVIASGGVAGPADIERAIELSLGGIIVGRALYEGKIDLKEALALAARPG